MHISRFSLTYARSLLIAILCAAASHLNAQTGPVSWYSFDDPTQLGRDTTGANNATSVVGLTSTPGKRGNAAHFVNGFIGLPNSASLRIRSGDFTLSVFVKSTSSANNRNWFTKASTTTHEYGLGGNGRVGIAFDGGPGGGSESATNIMDGTWHHVAGVKRGSTAEIWVDGGREGTGSISGSSDSGTFAIGRDGACCESFNGDMDEAKIWNRALSAAEIAAEAGTPNTLCYIDLACSSGNQYLVRDSGSGQCVSMNSCTQLWKCPQGPTAGTCGGGSVDCTFSPGCFNAVQTCFAGTCTSILQCNDRIKYQGYAFNPSPNQCDCQANPPAAGPSCALPTFPLTVSKVGSGTGAVTSSPAGVNCGLTCSSSFNSGTVVTLSATPEFGSTFSGWSGACSGAGSCTVTMNSSAFVTATFTAAPPPGCVPNATTLCLSGGRFRVSVTWTDFNGNSGNGNVVPYSTGDSGLFWFFSSSNWEMMVKIINACPAPFLRYWVFAAGTTNVQYTLRVTDTLTGQVRQYANPLGTASAAITDTGAFNTCP